MVSREPRRTPKRMTASRAYSEQEGMNRQCPGIKGERQYRYRAIIPRSSLCIVSRTGPCGQEWGSVRTRTAGFPWVGEAATGIAAWPFILPAGRETALVGVVADVAGRRVSPCRQAGPQRRVSTLRRAARGSTRGQGRFWMAWIFVSTGSRSRVSASSVRPTGSRCFFGTATMSRPSGIAWPWSLKNSLKSRFTRLRTTELPVFLLTASPTLQCEAGSGWLSTKRRKPFEW